MLFIQATTDSHTKIRALGGDTTLRGAVVSGKQVVADIGGNLTIESLQDSSHFTSKDSNVGVGVAVGAGMSVSGSYSKSNVEGDFSSVREQSGIQAGDGGFQINVAGNTDLIGAVIASSQQAVNEGLNSLTTGTLTTRDLENHSDYQAAGMSVSGGVSWGGRDKGEGSENTTGSNVAGKGSEWSWQNAGSNASVGAPGYSRESGADSSITQSGISAGVVAITDEAQQQQLTGESVEDRLASLNRDVLTGDSANGLTKNWDADKLAAQVQAQAEIAAAFSQQAYAQVDKYVQSERAELQARLQAANTPEEKAALESELHDLKMQERVMNVLIGAVTGSGVSAITKETLAAAADEMRRLMIEDSSKFVGITDGETSWNNISGESVGVDGDGVKLGGTRIDLDIFCGEVNERCKTNPDGSLELDDNGWVQFDAKKADTSLAQFLQTEEGKKAIGATGGLQGDIGTLFGMPYQAGSWVDKLVEAFAGTHDFVGGELSGLYDEQGNATRGRSPTLQEIHEKWSVVAIAPSAPFAAAQGLPPEIWQAIAIFLKASR